MDNDSTQPPRPERRADPSLTPEQAALRAGRSPFVERRSGVAMTPQQVAARRPPSYLDGPTWSFVTMGGLLVIALFMLGLGYTRPVDRLVPLAGAYQQAGHFSYLASVTKPTPIYPSGVVTTGEPIYPNLIDSVAVTFRYNFTTALPHNITGTIALRVLLLSKSDTWQEVSTLKAVAVFRGDSTTVTGSLALKDLYSLINNLAVETGIPGATYSADIQPIVMINGDVGGKPINQSFVPVLPFNITAASITLNVASAPAPPGATYVLPSATDMLTSTVAPTQVGTIPHLVPNAVSIAKYHIEVPLLRVLGLIFAALAILSIIAFDLVRRRRTLRTDEELIARRFHSLIVPVVSLSESGGRAPIDVQSFAHLAGLAQFLERPILYAMTGGERVFAVDDDGLRYCYRPSQTSQAPRSGDASERRGERRLPVEVPSVSRRRQRHTTLARGGTAFLVVGTAITLSTSFTASLNVPTSHVGTSTQARLVSQLAPAGCSSLSLTSLVTGSGTFSNSKSQALILGTAGANTITDTGAFNCIVGGGGTNTVIAPATDICISGPTLNLANPCSSPSNGVSVAPTSDNYNNYGGQERLAVANVSAITAMTITINVAATTGITYNSQYNSFPGGTINQSVTTQGGTITYTWVLKTSKTIPAGYQGGMAYAQFTGTGSPHANSGDTWSITTTASGIDSTLSGTF